MKTPRTSILNSIFLFIALLLLTALVVFKINKMQEMDVQKNKAIHILKTELVNNRYRLNSWMQLDDKTRMQIDSLIDKTRSDENYEGRLPSELIMNERRNISTDQSIFAFEESAWKTLQNSGVAKHLDYEILYNLENVYSSQRLVIDAYAKIPVIKITSEKDRKYSVADYRFLVKLRSTYSKLQLAESKLDGSYYKVFRLPEFTTENEE